VGHVSQKLGLVFGAKLQLLGFLSTERKLEISDFCALPCFAGLTTLFFQLFVGLLQLFLLVLQEFLGCP